MKALHTIETSARSFQKTRDTVGCATTNDATTNEEFLSIKSGCYNEQFLSIKSGCYKERMLQRKVFINKIRMLQWRNVTTNSFYQ